MWRSSLVLAAGLWLGGCAAPPPTVLVPAFRDPAMSMQDAHGLIVPGTTTRAALLASLGLAPVVRFDSGWEVWIYREKEKNGKRSSQSVAGSPAELVILLDGSGVVKKSRIKPAYPS